MARAVVILALLIIVGFAGCAEEPTPVLATTTTEPAIAPPAQFTDSTGAIDGLVHDAEFLPLEGVEIGIPQLELSTMTGADGRFTFSQLDIGTYEVFAQRLGYESSARSVEIRAGEATSLELSLSGVQIIEPYSQTLIKKGLLGCAIQVDPVTGLSACGIGQVITLITGQDTSSVDKFRLEWDVKVNTTAWYTTVHEMQWRSTQALGSGLRMVWEVNLCSGDPKNTFGDVEGRSPLRVQADFDKLQTIPPSAPRCLQQGLIETDQSGECNEQMCRLQSRVFQAAETTNMDVDVGAAIMQPFEQFFTVFFHAPGPNAYTALSDA